MRADLTINDLAERTGMSRKFWERQVSGRAITFTQFGTAVRFTEAQIAQIIADAAAGAQHIPTRGEVSARRRRKATT